MARRLVENVVLRNPATGAPTAFLVGAELPAWANKLVTNDALFGDVEEPDGPTHPEGDPTGKWTVPQLKAYAEENGIDLGGATRKDDVLQAVTGQPADTDTGAGDDEAEGDDDGEGDPAGGDA